MSLTQSKIFKDHFAFTVVILVLVLLAGYVTGNTQLAMWFGFALAGYSAVSNDSIQTLGTFLSSNSKVKWYWLWLFLGSILVATLTYGWMTHGGDVSYGRLNKIPQPESFQFVQLLAPVVLLILTRFKMPVSTTFLLLAVFSESKTIAKMVNKTFTGYFLAFFVAILVWGLIAYLVKRYNLKKLLGETKNELIWRVFQWGATAFLWSAWLMQDSANAAVFLPRGLTQEQLIGMLAFLTLGLGYILYQRGGPIQTIIQEKTDVVYVKSATLIDLVYGCVLVYFKWINDIPMSTTWVFLGLLAGREFALSQLSDSDEPYKNTLVLVMKDLVRAGIGLGISLLLALVAQGKLMDFFGL